MRCVSSNFSHFNGESLNILISNSDINYISFISAFCVLILKPECNYLLFTRVTTLAKGNTNHLFRDEVADKGLTKKNN